MVNCFILIKPTKTSLKLQMRFLIVSNKNPSRNQSLCTKIYYHYEQVETTKKNWLKKSGRPSSVARAENSGTYGFTIWVLIKSFLKTVVSAVFLWIKSSNSLLNMTVISNLITAKNGTRRDAKPCSPLRKLRPVMRPRVVQLGFEESLNV